MRKTSVRKFIHMVIDILPLLIIPIFALNILHKETEPISIEVQEKISVDFNQEIQQPFLLENDIDQWTFIDNASYTYIDNEFYLTCTNSWGARLRQRYVYTIPSHKYLIKSYVNLNSSNNVLFEFSRDWTKLQTYVNANTDTLIEGIVTIPNLNTDTYNMFQVYVNGTNNYQMKIKYINVFDLTKMFGSGNEPTVEQFNNIFNSIYEYTESQKMLVNKPSPTTYNDTDIGSQFVYALYKPVNDYFNFNNLFNMGAIYNWIELNLFSGTAPLPIFIIWNVIVYEFFVDLIFLLYGVFMFIIDFAEKCLERPFRR